MSSDLVELAATRLLEGGVVAFPTETVYGLGALASRPAAVRKVFELKGRPLDRALIIHVASVTDVDHIARHVPDYARSLIDAFWPGPLTLVLPRCPAVPDEVTGGGETVAVRMPAHPLALALLRRLSERDPASLGVAAPSANRFGDPPATSAAEVARRLGEAGEPGGPDLILDGGPCEGSTPSTLLRCDPDGPRVLRVGALPVARIEARLGRPVIAD